MTDLRTATGLPEGSQPLPWLIVTGQPTLEMLAAARDAGATAVIDLRDPMEPRPFSEPDEVARLGMSYHNFPVRPGALDDKSLQQALEVLRSQAGQGTVLHCASANRTGGPLIAYLIIDQGMDEQEAINAAMRAGLRSAEILEWGLDYARRHRQS